VGLVTAVIARGDADSLIDATASFVDPSGTHAAASGSAAMASLQSKFVAPLPVLTSSPDTTLAQTSEEPKAVALADLPTAAPQPQKPAPVAYAAPAWRPAPRAWRPAPRSAAKAEKAEAKEKEEKVAAAASSKGSANAAPAKHNGKATDDDVESASAADALAKAQLEASLR
jgi:hypothetical protein